ncbi:polyketide cyclase [Rhodococcus sp. NPDC076796]|uniref:polyketide cyclase n=1 Tax=Rhodococcus sp. NPDC076796 TaxID=3154859 RepID=UPI00344C77D0
MTDQLTVRREIDAPPASVFTALANPEVQAAVDGSEMLRGAIDPTPLEAVGDTFAMDMYQPELGEYVMENTVFVFEQDRRIGWIPRRQGMEPRGTRWSWELDAVSADRTALTQVYDWSRVTDPEFRKMAGFPRVTEDQIVDTMRRLADHLGVRLED